MKKFTVQRLATGFAVFDVRGGQVGVRVFAEEWEARLAGVHWACAPSLVKQLNLKKVDGILSGRPFGGVQVGGFCKQPTGRWAAIVTVDGDRRTYVGRTQKEVCLQIKAHGDDIMKTRNILNRDAGEIDIARSEWGGCTDPGTETYHCM